MVLNADIGPKVQAIHNKVKADGALIKSGSADVYELGGVKSMISDGGYSIQLVTEDLIVWSEYGSGKSDFVRGSLYDLNMLVEELEIAL